MPPVTSIKPTIGRVVYFKTRGSLDGKFPPTDFVGIITKVHSDTEVSLVTFGEAGMRFELNVQQGSVPGMWDWMPFQKDQQARLAAPNPTTPNGGAANATASAGS